MLAQIAGQVCSVERIKPLQDKARQRLRRLGLRNVQLRHADGGFGWPEMGPFNAIISTAAPREVPPELLSQLAAGGALVIPVGSGTQQLQLILREGDADEFSTQTLEAVKFVPLLSGTTR